ncbi:MAG: Fic family protein [Proteobacteria bacterium]|nr:Fic family protein [Pseudomonadota bacterium]
MIFTYRSLDAEEAAVLDRINEMRRQLRYYVVQEPRRWTGLLARMTRARALRASNSIEGIIVSAEDALAAIDNEDPTEADKSTWQAVAGYHAAMDYILQRCRDQNFQFSKDVLLAVHFMISQHDLNANPGNYRPGWVGVHNTQTGELVHEGVDRDLLEPLVDELIDYMNDADEQPVILKAAMTHLNLTLLHPFSDGNGRTARCFQTAVLTNEGIVAPIFSSIEEYTGQNQQEYYDVLTEVGGGGWNPERDSQPWVRFCLKAHYRQARTLLRRTREIERVYNDLHKLVTGLGLPERTALALVEALSGLRVRNASYRVSSDISNNLASRDLKALVDAELLVPQGERRGRSYSPADLVQQIRNRHRTAKEVEDPFASW